MIDTLLHNTEAAPIKKSSKESQFMTFIAFYLKDIAVNDINATHNRLCIRFPSQHNFLSFTTDPFNK